MGGLWGIFYPGFYWVLLVGVLFRFFGERERGKWEVFGKRGRVGGGFMEGVHTCVRDMMDPASNFFSLERKERGGNKGFRVFFLRHSSQKGRVRDKILICKN